MTETPDDRRMNDDGITTTEIQTTYKVLEQLRENANADGRSDHEHFLNEAHYLLQQYEEGSAWHEPLDAEVGVRLTFSEVCQGTLAAVYEAAGYDVDGLTWLDGGGLEIEFVDPDQ